MSETILLNSDAIRSKLNRIAIEIIENNFKEQEIVLLGIYERGALIAEFLAQEIKKEQVNVSVGYIHIDKLNPLKHPINLNFEGSLNNKVIVLVDDVANSGATLFYAFQPLINLEFKKLQIAVLVDRQHKKFPIAPDYIGISVSTTLQEMIYVKTKTGMGDAIAYLQ